MCDYECGRFLREKWTGLAFYFCDCVPPMLRYSRNKDKDIKYQQDLKQIKKNQIALEKLALVAEHPNASQEKIDKYLSQLPEKDQNLMRGLGLKPAALRWQLNQYRNQKKIYTHARALLHELKIDDVHKIIFNTVALVISSPPDRH